jgi:uncharacterized membrane protein YeaQ/YmgE (transglycosylase-associated protein family)
METTALMEQAQAWANTVLVWIGFGTVVGLLAKAIMPGRDPGGAIATLAMGIGGTVIGCGILSWAQGGVHVTPISPLGLAVATAGAFILLFFYRLLGGYWFTEGEGRRFGLRGPHRYVRRYPVEYVDRR